MATGYPYFTIERAIARLYGVSVSGIKPTSRSPVKLRRYSA
jgi:hypothetical protein